MTNEKNKKRLYKILIGLGVFILSAIMEPFSVILQTVLQIISYLILGGDVVKKAFGNIKRGRLFDENFLMSIATIGAFAIGEHPEEVMVMFFYQLV